MSSPRVSILIPSYNHEAFLPACIASIQAQTFSDWEVILIDDGSKDGSVRLARELAEQEPRMTALVNEKNLGTYGTEERARQMARGEYISVMNSDDFWHPEKLERQVRQLDAAPDCGLSYVLGAMVDKQGAVIEDEDVHLDWPRTERQDPMPFLLYENRILASGVLFRHDRLTFNPSCRYSGDWVALIEHAVRGPFACIPEPLTFWRQHENNTYLRSTNQMIEEVRVRRSISRHTGFWMQGRWPKAEVRRGLERNLNELFHLELYFGDRAGARRLALKGLLFRRHKKSAVKRALSTFSSLQFVRNYYFQGQVIDWSKIDGAGGPSLLKRDPPIHFTF